MKKIALFVPLLLLAGCFNNDSSPVAVTDDVKVDQSAAFEEFLNFEKNSITGSPGIPGTLRTAATICAVESDGWVGDTLYVSIVVDGWTQGPVRAVGCDFTFGPGLVYEGYKVNVPYANWTAFGANLHPTLNLVRFGGFCSIVQGCDSTDPAEYPYFLEYKFTATSGFKWLQNEENFDDLAWIDPGCYTAFNLQSYED